MAQLPPLTLLHAALLERGETIGADSEESELIDVFGLDEGTLPPSDASRPSSSSERSEEIDIVGEMEMLDGHVWHVNPPDRDFEVITELPSNFRSFPRAELVALEEKTLREYAEADDGHSPAYELFESDWAEWADLCELIYGKDVNAALHQNSKYFRVGSLPRSDAIADDLDHLLDD